MYLDNENFEPYHPGYFDSKPSIFFRGKYHTTLRDSSGNLVLSFGVLKEKCRELNRRYANLQKETR